MYICPSSGQRLLKAREAFKYGRGEDQSVDALKTKFDEFCPGHATPYEANPFFTCVERAGLYPNVLTTELTVINYLFIE